MLAFFYFHSLPWTTALDLATGDICNKTKVVIWVAFPQLAVLMDLFERIQIYEQSIQIQDGCVIHVAEPITLLGLLCSNGKESHKFQQRAA